jgi:hypothetical protein
LRRGQPQVDALRDRTRNENSHRDHRLGRGGSAVISGFEWPVPEGLVNSQHGLALMQ